MYKIVRNFLSDEEVDFFRSYEGHIHKSSAVGPGRSESYDTSRIAESKVFKLQHIDRKIINKFLDIANELKPNAAGYFPMEPWSVQTYHSHNGGKFDWHIDRLDYFIPFKNPTNISKEEWNYVKNSSPQREVSFSVALNDKKDYNGGDFIIDTGDEKQTSVELNRGDLCVFDSDTYHGVRPVTDRKREALIVWLVYYNKFEDWIEDVELPEILSEGVSEYYESVRSL